MSVTEQLVRLFLVDKQIWGLTSRQRQAEQFLGEQIKSLAGLEAQRAAVEAQLKLAAAQAAERESEVKRLEARIAQLAEQMNASQSHKQYKAFLAEINGLKGEKSVAETAALDAMTRADELRRQLAQIDAQRDERAKVRGLASAEAQQRAAEIRERLETLQAERASLVGLVPAEALAVYERLVAVRGEDAMARIEPIDPKHHEYNCGSCMMSLPVDLVSGLLGRGNLTKCASCGCILYVDQDTLRPETKTKKPAATKN
jgi:predicted  nucleic acid-binding Zn-ribbon protein